MTSRRQIVLSAGGVLVSSCFAGNAFASGGKEVATTLAARRASRDYVFRIIGIGGAGCNVLEEIRHQKIAGLEDTVMIGRRDDARHPGAHPDDIANFELTDWDPGSIREVINHATSVCVIAGLGGATGTRIAPVVAQAARKAGAEVVAALILPFGFESKRCVVAQRAVRQIEKLSTTTLLFSNEEQGRLAGPHALMLDVLSQVSADIVKQVGDQARKASSSTPRI